MNGSYALSLFFLKIIAVMCTHLDDDLGGRACASDTPEEGSSAAGESAREILITAIGRKQLIIFCKKAGTVPGAMGDRPFARSSWRTDK